MKFLTPAAFWFAATIPVVVLFYLLKRKRVVKLVSSTLLWQKFLAETQANAPFQRLRHNWLLWLQLLLLLLAIFALSRPYVAGDANSGPLRVMILDASASMQSTDVEPSRFEKARGQALDWVNGMKDEDQMLLLVAGAQTQVKQSATSSKVALRRALESCEVTDSPTQLKEALKLAETLTRDKAGAEIHLFSDGAIRDLSEFENKGMNVIFHRVGNSAENLGIIALDVRSHPENARQRAIYTSVQNFSTNAQQADLELRFGEDLVEIRPLNFGPGEVVPQVFFATQNTNGVFSVNLKAEDQLSVDNRASVFSQVPSPVRVLLVTRGNRFLEKALRSTANVELSIAADFTDGAGADVVVLDDVFPLDWPKGNLLAIHVAPTNWFDSVGAIENPALVDWKSAHPLLRYVNFDNVRVSEAVAVKTPPWAVSLLDAPQASLLLAGERDRQKIVWVSFDTLQSTWPLRISFPIFVANAIEFLNPAATRQDSLFVRAGEPFRFPLVETVANASVVVPGGQKQTIPFAEGAREIIFGDTARQGIYRITAGTNEMVFCVNLLDAEESNIRPREELQFGKYAKVQATTLKRADMEWWRWIAGAALAVLLVEWWYYHRRTA